MECPRHPRRLPQTLDRRRVLAAARRSQLPSRTRRAGPRNRRADRCRSPRSRRPALRRRPRSRSSHGSSLSLRSRHHPAVQGCERHRSPDTACQTARDGSVAKLRRRRGLRSRGSPARWHRARRKHNVHVVPMGAPAQCNGQRSPSSVSAQGRPAHGCDRSSCRLPEAPPLPRRRRRVFRRYPRFHCSFSLRLPAPARSGRRGSRYGTAPVSGSWRARRRPVLPAGP